MSACPQAPAVVSASAHPSGLISSSGTTAYVHPRNRKIRKSTDVGTPSSHKTMEPIAPSHPGRDRILSWCLIACPVASQSKQSAEGVRW